MISTSNKTLSTCINNISENNSSKKLKKIIITFNVETFNNKNECKNYNDHPNFNSYNNINSLNINFLNKDGEKKNHMNLYNSAIEVHKLNKKILNCNNNYTKTKTDYKKCNIKNNIIKNNNINNNKNNKKNNNNNGNNNSNDNNVKKSYQHYTDLNHSKNIISKIIKNDHDNYNKSISVNTPKGRKEENGNINNISQSLKLSTFYKENKENYISHDKKLSDLLLIEDGKSIDLSEFKTYLINYGKKYGIKALKYILHEKFCMKDENPLCNMKHSNKKQNKTEKIKNSTIYHPNFNRKQKEEFLTKKFKEININSSINLSLINNSNNRNSNRNKEIGKLSNYYDVNVNSSRKSIKYEYKTYESKSTSNFDFHSDTSKDCKKMKRNYKNKLKGNVEILNSKYMNNHKKHGNIEKRKISEDEEEFLILKYLLYPGLYHYQRYYTDDINIYNINNANLDEGNNSQEIKDVYIDNETLKKLIE